MPNLRANHSLLAMAAALVMRAAPLHAQASDSRPGLQPLEMFAAFGADPALDETGTVSESVQPMDVHGVIVQYRNALRGWLTADERARLDAIDISGTADVDARRLRYLAADRALRRFAPMALDAVVHTRQASRLRSITAVVDERTAMGATRVAVVAGALRRSHHVAVATADAFARSFLESSLETTGRSEFDARLLSADRAVIAAANCASRAEIGEAAQSAREAADASGPRAEDRAMAVEAALELLSDMIALARGIPILEPRIERPMPAGDPFEPLLDAVRQRAQRGPRNHRAEHTAHVRALPTFDSFLGLPP